MKVKKYNKRHYLKESANNLINLPLKRQFTALINNIMVKKNQKPIDSLKFIKRLKAKRKDKEDYYGLADFTEYVPPSKKRFPFWLRIKSYFQDVADRFEMKFDMAIKEAVKMFVLYYGWVVVLVILVGIAMIMGC